MGTDFDKKLGKRIKFFRLNAGYTQEKFAEILNCEPSSISHYEIGKDRISLTRLIKIAEELNVDLYKFFLPVEPETDEKTIESISKLLRTANKTQLGLIYKMINNIIDLTDISK